MSATFSSERTWPKRTNPAATASRTRIIWQDKCFFLILDEGKVVLITHDRLSPNSSLHRSTGIPRQRSLYLILMIRSTAIRAAIISEPKVDVSTVRCRLDIHTKGVLLIRSNIPVTDLRVTRLRAWSASTYTVILTSFPYGSGDFSGISSSASGKYSFQSQSRWNVACFCKKDQKNL